MNNFKIGIDLDNTITASEESETFFTLITNALKGKAKIYIITNRTNSKASRKSVIKELSKMNIYYDELIITDKKAEYMLDEGISVYFDDTDEYF